MTSAPRSAATVFVASEFFEADSAEVTGDSYRHLFRARRLAVDDRLRVVDGRGHAREGRVATVGRDRARLELGASLPSHDSSLDLGLIVASPRPERASWLVEKATELGVSRIAWLHCARSPRRFSAAVLARHGRIAISALEQCGGATLPIVSGPHEWSELGGLVGELDAWWVLDPAGVRQLDSAAAGARALGLAIGPEGGWDQAERAALESLGGVSWSLGERILRIETAALAGAALLLRPFDRVPSGSSSCSGPV